MDEYEQRALDFLKDTDTELTVVWLSFGLYFPGDQDERDIYRVTLKRSYHIYTFKFGDSIARTEQGLGIIPEWVERGFSTKTVGQIDSIKAGIRELARNHKPPSAYDILSTMEKSDPGTFEEFCSEFDYSTELIQSKKIYKECHGAWLQINTMFDEEELDELREIN